MLHVPWALFVFGVLFEQDQLHLADHLGLSDLVLSCSSTRYESSERDARHGTEVSTKAWIHLLPLYRSVSSASAINCPSWALV